MMRSLSFVAVAILILGVATSHDLLLAKGGKPDCTGKPEKCEDPGQRFSRHTCGCVDKGKEKQLICHVDVEEVIDETTGEVTVIVTESVINVSVESAHIRKGKHGDCDAPEGAVEGDPCTCAEDPSVG